MAKDVASTTCFPSMIFLVEEEEEEEAAAADEEEALLVLLLLEVGFFLYTICFLDFFSFMIVGGNGNK